MPGQINPGGLGVGTESALHNSGSAADAINCPKCGFLQERRLDCKKCGIVFSKYFALYPPSSFVEGPLADTSNAQEPSGPDIRALVSEMQTQIQVLTGKFAEIEFEKVERNLLRADLKNLERQLSEQIETVRSELEAPVIPPPQPPAVDPRFAVIDERLEQIDSKLGSYDFAGQYMVELSEKCEGNARQVSELQQQICSLRDELEVLKSQMEILAQVQKVEDPRTPLEEDVRAIRKNLDEFRAYLAKSAVS